jgi:hypothetical protein
MDRTIKQILIERDGMTAEEADELIAQAKAKLEEYLEEGDFSGYENICEEFFGLEPDFLDELMGD